jgi:hypothetical protein
MRRVTRPCGLILAAGSYLFSEVTVPERWIGKWILSPQESKIGALWALGAKSLTIVSQTLEITTTADRMKVAGDTLTTEHGSIHDQSEVNLNNGQIAIPAVPGLSMKFKRIDDNAFDIVVGMNSASLGNHIGVNHFVFSPDGKTLTETKTHTEREAAPEGKDQTEGAIIRTSTSTLVFHRPVSR